MSLVAGYSSSEDESAIPVLPQYEIIANPDVELPKQAVVIDKTTNTSKVYHNSATFELQAKLSRKRKLHITKAQAKNLRKRRRQKEEYVGPWGKFESEDDEDNQESGDLAQQEEEDDDEVDEVRQTSEYVGLVKSDYLGRTYMYVPKELKKESGSFETFVPKSVIHTFDGHTGGVNKLEIFPRSGHLLLSAGNDGKIKLWDMYNKKELLRIFHGHRMPVKDICFNLTGERFLSGGYDMLVHLWSTETGDILKTIRVAAIPNVLKFNPNNEDEFIVGLTNHNIEHYDLSTLDYEKPIQTYTHHLGAINSLTVIEDGKRFISTADDKSIRFWDWQINIPVKLISDPTQHSIPTAAIYPGGQFIALQSMDNTIQVLQGHGKYKAIKSKKFSGHNVAGYGISIDISPDGKTIMSGDSKGYGYFWDWKTGNLIKRIKVCTKAVTTIVSHPQETTAVIMAGVTDNIYYCK